VSSGNLARGLHTLRLSVRIDRADDGPWIEGDDLTAARIKQDLTARPSTNTHGSPQQLPAESAPSNKRCALPPNGIDSREYRREDVNA